MKPAIIVVDMLKDHVDIDARYSIGEEGRRIIPNIQRLLRLARENKIPIVYACDSFLMEDFVSTRGLFMGGNLTVSVEQRALRLLPNSSPGTRIL